MTSNSHKKTHSISLASDNPGGKVSALESRLAEAQARLNPRRRELVRAILDSADETCFLSSRELAKRYRVDATTILRATRVEAARYTKRTNLNQADRREQIREPARTIHFTGRLRSKVRLRCEAWSPSELSK